MDPDAAEQFLGLAVQLLCRRMRAMNDRLVAWRVMAGHRRSRRSVPIGPARWAAYAASASCLRS